MYDKFKGRMSRQGQYMGQVLKNQSDAIMDATFSRDPAYRVCYLQDNGTVFPEQTLDGYKKAKAVFSGKETYDVDDLRGFSKIECKYLVKSYYSIQGDAVDYYLQFRPNVHGSNPNIRIGSLVFVPDDLGVYNLWMIVARDDRPQFPQFYILRVNLLMKWYIGHNEIVKFEGNHVDVGSYVSWAVQRTQSSYNSGVWSDYSTTTVENQLKAILPTNLDTNTITYNERFVITDNPLRRVVWEVTKVEDTTTRGLTKLTFAQQLEHDPIDNMSWVNITSDIYSDSQTGIDYDYYCERRNDAPAHSNTVVPFEQTLYTNDDNNTITYSGVKPSVKVGGSYKTFTANLNILGKPYWRIAYVVDGQTVCTVKFKYNGDNLVCDNAQGVFDVVDMTKVSYSDDGQKVFGIQFKHNPEKPYELKVKCQSLLSMLNGKIVISAGDSQFMTFASIEVGVEGL